MTRGLAQPPHYPNDRKTKLLTSGLTISVARKCSNKKSPSLLRKVIVVELFRLIQLIRADAAGTANSRPRRYDLRSCLRGQRNDRPMPTKYFP